MTEAAPSAPVVHPDDPARRRRLLLRAVVTTLGSVLAVVVAWRVFVLLPDGRRFENLVWRSRSVVDRRFRLAHDDALRLVTTTTLAAGLLAVLVVGAVRRRLLLGVLTCGGIVGATLTTQVLKRLVLNRPPTLGELPRISTNSFPSGHATICTAVALGVLLLTAQRWRRLVGVLATVWVSVQGIGVVAAGWHRPSDTVSGYGVAMAWMAAVVAALALLRRTTPERVRLLTAARTRTLVLAGAAVVAAVTVVGVVVGGDSTASREGAVYVASVAALLATGVMTVWWFWDLLEGWRFGPRADFPPGADGPVPSAGAAPTAAPS